MCVSVLAYAHMCGVPEGDGYPSPKDAVPDSCELPVVDAGNQTQALCRYMHLTSEPTLKPHQQECFFATIFFQLTYNI